MNIIKRSGQFQAALGNRPGTQACRDAGQSRRWTWPTAHTGFELSVQAATAAGTGSKTGDDVYVDAAIEPRAPYVQQQVQLT